MISYSITVRMHLAPLPVVTVLFYYTISAYAGFVQKVTFENRTGDSQPVRCKFSYIKTVLFHLAPLPVVSVHFDYTIPAYAEFGANSNFEDIEGVLTCESCF